MRFRRIEGYLILGMYLVAGILLGYSISKEKPVTKSDTVTVDIVKEGDEILIYLSRCSKGALRDEHYSAEIVFEYNKKNKEVDKTAYQEFEDVYVEGHQFLPPQARLLFQAKTAQQVSSEIQTNEHIPPDY